MQKYGIFCPIAIKWKEKNNAVVVDCHHSLCGDRSHHSLCGHRMKMSLLKKCFFRETPTSPRKISAPRVTISP